MKWLHYISSLLFLFILGLCSYAQTAEIPDPGFRQYLMDTHPSYFNENDELIIDSARKKNSIKAYHYGIKDLTGIEHFVNLSVLDVSNNELTFIPDLTMLTQLDELIIDSNRVDSMAPIQGITTLRNFKCDVNNLDKLPEVSGMTTLQRIFCRSNNLTEIPDLSGCSSFMHLICTFNQIDSLSDFASTPSMFRLICHNNQLSSLPDYSQHPNLRELLAWNNQFTFDDILVMTRQSTFDTEYHISPQDSADTKTVYNAVQNEDLTLDLAFDDTVTTNTYMWYKDGNLLTTTNINELSIPNIQLTDAGTYHVIVTNSHPSLGSISLVSKMIRVNVFSCLGIDNASYDVIDANCQNGATVLIDEGSLIISNPPATYSLVNQTEQDTLTFMGPELNELLEGKYDLIISDINNCEAMLPSFIQIDHNSECDPVFSPDGDGKNDTYYVEQVGIARIFNTSGELIKEFSTPAYWEGTKNDGSQAPMGYYSIIINEREVINVTLLR